jgi:hypothetical protein
LSASDCARLRRNSTFLSGSPAFRFVLAIGIVNLFADMTYEGAASINGPFLGTLGANAAAVSIVAGVGEFLGYLAVLAACVLASISSYAITSA